MQLTPNQATELLKLAGNETLQKRVVPAGAVLQTRSASKELFLVIEGQCRVLDPGRLLGSLTIMRADAPYLCGALSLLEPSLQEEVTASTECTLLVLGSAPLNEALTHAVMEQLRSRVAPSELPLLRQLVSSRGLPIDDDQCSASIFQRRWRPAEPSDLADQRSSNTILVYADSSARGFKHGQLINATTLLRFWPESLPRVLIWSDGSPSVRAAQTGSKASAAIEAGRDNHPLPTASTEPDHAASKAPHRPTMPSGQSTPRHGLTESAGSAQQRLRRLGYQLVSGTTADKRHEAALAMICQHFELPIRRDSLKKAGTFLAEGKGGATMDRLVNVLDQLSLIGRVIVMRPTDLSRLPTPAILLDQEQNPLLIVEANSQGLLCVDPAEGPKLRTTDDVMKKLGENLRAVVISTGAQTPKKRFSLGWMLPYLSQYKLPLAEVFIASLVTQLFALATPMLFQQIIDRVIGQGATNALMGFAALMVLFMLLELIFSSLRSFQFMEISNRVDISIGSAIISRLLRLNARYFEKRPVGELSSRLNELEKIRSFLTGTALTVVLDALFALLYFGVMFFYSPILSAIILGSIPLLMLVTIGFTPMTQSLIRQRAEAYSRTQSYMVEVLNGIQTIKLQNSELTARRNWEDRHLDGINKGFRTVLANTASSNALQLINKTTNILIITVGAWLVLKNELTLGGLIAFRIISGNVTQPILRLSSTWNNFQEVSMSVERLGDVVNQPLETSEHEAANISMPPIAGKITFDQVSFGYSSSSRPQLAGVSLEIPAGSFTGLVGQSGCGKSTMLKLVPRLYEPLRGKVLIDDFDVSKVELYSLRRQLGFVPQDCLLFEGSVYSNIAVGDPEAETDQVIQAARLACAHDFIMTLAYGYSTPIGEKGSGLSGGQRQRIALARMLLQNPAMMILDEATSALDVDTEQQVVSNLRQHARGKTLLMITHRLSTLVNADQIVMMHEGRVDSVGTHDELMAKAGRYYALYQQQLGG